MSIIWKKIKNTKIIDFKKKIILKNFDYINNVYIKLGKNTHLSLQSLLIL